IEGELALYAEELADKPRFVVINKMDLPETRSLLEYVLPQLDVPEELIFLVSAVTGEGVQELLLAVARQLDEIPRDQPESADTLERRIYTLEPDDDEAWEVERLSAHHYEIRGKKIERTLAMTDFQYEEAAERFQN